MDGREILRLEELSLNAWPSLQTVLYRGCVLRFAEGYTKRSNSANPLYYRGAVDELARVAEAAYGRRGLPTHFKIIEHHDYADLDRHLEASGYAKIDSTTVMTLPLSDRRFPAHEGVRVEDAFSSAWVDAFIEANRLEARAATVRGILGAVAVDKAVASVEAEGKLVAFGFAALEAGWAGFFDIFVRQDHRGTGYGRKIMEALLGAAASRGAARGYLQVMDHNHPAKALYGKLGFAAAYGYWYRKRDARGPTGPQ